MIDNQATSKWVSADEAARIYAVTRAHWYVLASRKQFRTQTFNDGIKRYNVPNSYQREPNVELTVINNSEDIQTEDTNSLINQLNEAKEQLRQVEVNRLEEQIAILQEDKVYLRGKLDDIQSQLPKILETLGKLTQNNSDLKQKNDTLSTDKEMYKSWYESQNKMAQELREEKNEYKNVMLSIYKKFFDKKTK
jgi:chromosome segregation ATPase